MSQIMDIDVWFRGQAVQPIADETMEIEDASIEPIPPLAPARRRRPLPFGRANDRRPGELL